MRIAIDARMMGPEVTRGIGRYIEELVAAMLEIAPEHRYVLITRSAEHRFSAHPSVETIVADVQWYSIAEQLKMPVVFRRARADVLHIPHWNVPILHRGPYIITIHDLILLHAPDSAKASTRGPLVRWIKRLGHRLTLWRAVNHASRIIVPVDFVARDLISFYPQAANKIVVTGEGMPALHQTDSSASLGMTTGNKAQDDENRDLADAVSPYLLYVGAAYPHKGLQDLLAAWPKISLAYPDLQLKIAGEKDTFMRVLEASTNVVEPSTIADSAKTMKKISFLGRVSDAELNRFYDDALAFVYPTHFEGFGLPPLEALSRGCPVLSSDAGPLPEVLGSDGAIFFHVGDADGILAAVRELMGDPAKARQMAARVGPSLAARHDWKRAAACTLRAYGDHRHHCPAWHEG